MKKKLFRGLSGLNNISDPLRHEYDPKTGIGELSVATNCDIDDTLAISRRKGQTPISTTNPFHSAWSDGSDAYVIKELTSSAAIFRIVISQLGPPAVFALEGVRSGLTQGLRMSFWRSGGKTYYSNTAQNGVISGITSTPWPTNDHVGATTSRHFVSAPLGHLIAIFNGRMLIAVENVIYISEEFAYGKFAAGQRGWVFGSKIRMIRPVETGIWVSDEENTYFVAAAETIEAYEPKRRSPYPAHEWSVWHSLVDLSQKEIPGLSAVWSSDAGLCIGTADGTLIIDTQDKLIYPNGSVGATAVDGYNIIQNIY